jgi:hypothetical protein
MLRCWGGAPGRSTKDIDLMRSSTASVDELVTLVRRCLSLGVEDDGIQFHPDTVTGETIRVDADYNGVRLRFAGSLGTARLSLQVDVGFCDVVTPEPQEVTYPTLLDFEAPRLLGTTPETAVAEKLQAMVALDTANTRMKDFADLVLLARAKEFSGPLLARAIRATFERRKTALPVGLPTAWTREFHSSPIKQAQWRAYLQKSKLRGVPEHLADAVAEIARFLAPVLYLLSEDWPARPHWPPGGPWGSE